MPAVIRGGRFCADRCRERSLGCNRHEATELCLCRLEGFEDRGRNRLKWRRASNASPFEPGWDGRAAAGVRGRGRGDDRRPRRDAQDAPTLHAGIRRAEWETFQCALDPGSTRGMGSNSSATAGSCPMCCVTSRLYPQQVLLCIARHALSPAGATLVALLMANSVPELLYVYNICKSL